MAVFTAQRAFESISQIISSHGYYGVVGFVRSGVSVNKSLLKNILPPVPCEVFDSGVIHVNLNSSFSFYFFPFNFPFG